MSITPTPTPTDPTPPAPSLEAITTRLQGVWASGDYAQMGVRLVLIAERLAEACDLRSGERVLDVATGNGNTALAAARRGCETVGLDFVPSLLERGRARAVAEGLSIDFVEGDAQALPFHDESFDVVVSSIGAMFAADHRAAAAELVRVCRHGGRIGLASWTPDSFVGDLFRTTAGYAPPPPGLQPPGRWGSEEYLRDILGPLTATHTRRRTFVFRFGSAEAMADTFATLYGPTLKALESLDQEGRASLRADLVELIRRHDRAARDTPEVPTEYALGGDARRARLRPDGPGIVVPSTYLEAVMVR